MITPKASDHVAGGHLKGRENEQGSEERWLRVWRERYVHDECRHADDIDGYAFHVSHYCYV